MDPPGFFLGSSGPTILLLGCFNELCQEVQMDLDHSDKRAVGNSVEQEMIMARGRSTNRRTSVDIYQVFTSEML